MWLVNICMILPVLQWVVYFRNCLIANDIMKMVWAACMCIHPGGWIIKNWISREVIILNTGVVWVSLLMDLAGALKA